MLPLLSQNWLKTLISGEWSRKKISPFSGGLSYIVEIGEHSGSEFALFIQKFKGWLYWLWGTVNQGTIIQPRDTLPRDG